MRCAPWRLAVGGSSGAQRGTHECVYLVADAQGLWCGKLCRLWFVQTLGCSDLICACLDLPVWNCTHYLRASEHAWSTLLAGSERGWVSHLVNAEP